MDLPIKIDPEVYKLTGNQLVSMMMHGQLSIERFVRMLTPADPLVLIDDTIYALTPTEFYSLQRQSVYRQLSQTAFQYLIDHIEELEVPEAERTYMEEVRRRLPSCPVCEYRRYRDGVSNILHKYSIHLPKELLENEQPELPYSNAEYPQTTGEVVCKVGDKLLELYHQSAIERRPCLDCVEKHIMQARILANESLMGYPEHLPLACGHLEEAIAELPPQADALRLTLQFCLAKTNHEKRPFMPISLLLPLLGLLRQKGDLVDNTAKLPVRDIPAALELDCTPTVQEELKMLDWRNTDLLTRRLLKVDQLATETEKPTYREEWEGLMATAAENIAELAPTAANVMRNRRLMFVGAPELAKEAGYAMADFVNALRK